METLTLIPTDDSVVFPGMTVTPRPRGRRGGARPPGSATAASTSPRSARSPEVVERIQIPGGGPAVTVEGLHRGVAGLGRTPAPAMACGSRSPSITTTPAHDEHAAELAREYRAVVEEILELRDADQRIGAFLRSITEPGALADTSGYSPDLSFEQKRELLETLDVTERLEKARDRCSASAWPSFRSAGGSATTSSRAPSSSSASTSCASRWSRSARSSARTRARSPTSTASRSRRPGCPTTVREQAERELGRLERMGESGESSMIRTYLDWLLSVPWGERSDERLDPVHAREVLDADHAGLEDVKDRITEYIAVRKLRAERERRRRARVGRDPDPDRPARHRQDLDRRVDRPRDRARVRPHVAGRRPRRGRDPRPPPHLHRRPAGPPGPGASRRRNDEPGDHARRGRQGRRRLARRPVGGAARGAGPGAEPQLPRPLPGRRARPLRGAVHRHGEHRRDDSRRRCWTGWRSSASTATRPRRSSRSPAGYLLPRQLERNGLRPDEAEIADEAIRSRDHRVHPRGGRPEPRARARQGCCARRRPASPRVRPSRRFRSTSRRFARRSDASGSSRRRRSEPPSPAWRPASR